jgi:hypothetical protein
MWVGAPSVFWILDSGFWIPSEPRVRVECLRLKVDQERRLPHAALGDGEVARIGAALVWHLLASLQAQATSCVREVVLGVAARALALEEAHLLDQTFGGEQRCGGVVF